MSRAPFVAVAVAPLLAVGVGGWLALRARSGNARAAIYLEAVGGDLL